ncbi:MAG: hypothetical protein WD034_08670 [Parvibaculum sp.]|uniref:hypothetical protein n=1 Tax=Parvibaculum sp. TaxID=2024848 RepID=UPI0034A09955
MTTFTDRATLRPALWLARNARTAGVGAAFAAFLTLALRTRPPDDLLEALVVIVPALQAGFFAFIAAVAAEDRDAQASATTLRDIVLWFGASFIVIWLLVVFTRVSIDAYVRFGVPPMIGHTV